MVRIVQQLSYLASKPVEGSHVVGEVNPMCSYSLYSSKVGFRLTKPGLQSQMRLLSKDQMVGAIHVEIDEENYFGAKARVEDLYKADRESGFPLDIKLRLCPQIQDASDPTTITKFERLRIRQAAFLENIQKTQTGDIAVLDFVDEKLGMKTLRQLIMNIRDEDGVWLFISVDRHFLGRGFVFQYTVISEMWHRHGFEVCYPF